MYKPFTMDDLVRGNNFEKQSQEIKNNLCILLVRVNKLTRAYYDYCGRNVYSTSGLRSKKHHIEIYKQKLKDKFDISKVPMESKHLYGQADDIDDDDQFHLVNFCKINNSQILIDCELWAEDDLTISRLHVQIVPPKSGHRWFRI